MGEEDDYAVHLNPAWRDRANFILHADVDDGVSARRFEQLWARRLAPDRFEICRVPFFAYDLALGDEVEASGERWLVRGVVQPSGCLHVPRRLHQPRHRSHHRDLRAPGRGPARCPRPPLYAGVVLSTVARAVRARCRTSSAGG